VEAEEEASDETIEEEDQDGRSVIEDGEAEEDVGGAAVDIAVAEWLARAMGS
jgi:hypothetical protein